MKRAPIKRLNNYNFKSRLVGANQNIEADTIGYIQENNYGNDSQ